jgi:hypothetical protein
MVPDRNCWHRRPLQGGTTDAVDDLAWVFYSGAAFMTPLRRCFVNEAGNGLADSSGLFRHKPKTNAAGSPAGALEGAPGAVGLGAIPT